MDPFSSLKGQIQSVQDPGLWLEPGERARREKGSLAGGFWELDASLFFTLVTAPKQKSLSSANFTQISSRGKWKAFLSPEQRMFRSENRLFQCETALVIRFRAQARCLMVTCVHKASPLREEDSFYVVQYRGTAWEFMTTELAGGQRSDGINGDAHKTASGSCWRLHRVSCAGISACRTPQMSSPDLRRLAKTWRKVIASLKLFP